MDMAVFLETVRKRIDEFEDAHPEYRINLIPSWWQSLPAEASEAALRGAGPTIAAYYTGASQHARDTLASDGSPLYTSVAKAIAGRTQKRPAFNPDQTELALIYDIDTGSLLGVMAHRPRDFTAVADLRTPATSLAGLDLFARRDAKRVGIYGSGQQAWATFAGLCEMRKIESAKVYSPTPAHREGFAKKIMANTGVLVAAVNAPELAAKDVDIILCMTNTNVPVVDGSWLEEGQYIISVVGSNIELVKSGNLDAPRREIDDGTLQRCDLIVALSKSQAIDSQQGDIYWPVQNGVITWDKVVEISDVLAGKAAGRTDDKQIILYKNQGGQGIVDIALAKKCYDLARQHGKGYELRIEPRLNWWVQGGRAETW